MASRGVNKMILLGSLGQDPEVRFLTNGDAVANLSVATSESWKDKQTGEAKEKAEWHRVSIFGKLAEIAGEYLKKGSKVYLEGQLQTRKWTNKEGQDQYTTEVVVQGFNGVMQMLDSKPSGGQGQQQGQQAPQQSPQQGGFNQQQQQAPQQQGGFAQQGQQQAPQQSGFQQQAPQQQQPQQQQGGFAQQGQQQAPQQQSQQQGGFQQPAQANQQGAAGAFDDTIPF